MFAKILCTLAVFALFSSSHAAYKEDLEEFMTPWVKGALNLLPLVRLVVDEVLFLQKETLGVEPKLLNPIYSSANKKLTYLESQVASEGAKSCVGQLRAILDISTDKFRLDGMCFRRQQDKVENIVAPLVNALYPVAPSVACPLPLLCKIDFLSFNPRSFKEAMTAFKDVHKYSIELIKFLVYFKKEVTACRSDTRPYTNMASIILKFAPVCMKM